MNNEFVLRSGKHAGKTIGWLLNNQPSYLAWVQENRPEMLKGSDKKEEPKPLPKKEVNFRDEPIKTITPNMNFFNEGPADICKPYLDSMKKGLV